MKKSANNSVWINLVAILLNIKETDKVNKEITTDLMKYSIYNI